MVWAKGGTTTLMDLSVGVDVQTLRASMQELVPSEKNVRVDALADTLVVSGSVSDPIRLQRLMSLAEIFSGGKKVINLLHLQGSQQVMLEVKVAEVSKTLLDELGFEFRGSTTGAGANFGLLSALLGTGAGTASAVRGNTSIKLDAEIKKGLVKILAEPTITAISGQEGSFLAGGRFLSLCPKPAQPAEPRLR